MTDLRPGALNRGLGRRRARLGIALAVAAAALVALVIATSGSERDTAAATVPKGSWMPSAPYRRAVVWAVGDGADGSDRAKAVAALIARDRPDAVLYLGDVYQRGTREEFAGNYATTYGRLRRITAPTPGNHEWPLRREGYDRYWGRVHGRPTPSFYHFLAGGWRVLSLNSESAHGARSAQVRWLRRAVRPRGTCRLAFWHRPRRSAGTHRDQPDVQPLWSALRGKARIVLNGHDHDMQRFAPVNGIHEFIAGAGGHGDRYPVGDRAGLRFENDTDDGALRLVLRPGSARWAFVAVDGRVLDRGRLTCRRR